SIARAVLKNPPIMVLDEATSALDTESERLVQDALENMMKDRTSIDIAHRLSTIQNAATIVVINKGEIVEQKTHEELMRSKKGYKKLVEMQNFGNWGLLGSLFEMQSGDPVLARRIGNAVVEEPKGIKGFIAE